MEGALVSMNIQKVNIHVISAWRTSKKNYSAHLRQVKTTKKKDLDNFLLDYLITQSDPNSQKPLSTSYMFHLEILQPEI